MNSNFKELEVECVIVMAVNKTGWPLRENHNISDFGGLVVCENWFWRIMCQGKKWSVHIKDEEGPPSPTI